MTKGMALPSESNHVRKGERDKGSERIFKTCTREREGERERETE